MARTRAVPLAKDLIKAVETVKTGGSGTPFDLLPPKIANFFKKYPPAPFASYSDKPTSTHAADANPFLPNKHPVTNKWHNPKYSLREQSDLYKQAYRFGIEHLLPKLGNNKKFYEEKYESKTPVKGSTQFKLTKGERSREQREKEVQDALAKADQVIIDAKGAAARRRFERKANKRPGFF